MNTTLSTLSNIAQSFVIQLSDIMPKLALALVILFAGWLIARTVATIINRLLIAINIAWLDEKLKSIEIFQALNIKSAIVASRLIYWIVMLMAITTALEILGLNTIKEGINNFIAYLPKLLSAIMFFIVGTFIANVIKNVTSAAFDSMGIGAGKIISGFIFYFLVMLFSITALNQAGIDTAIITQNITIGVAAIFFAFALAYGFASRDIMANLLSSFYTKDKFNIGQNIRIGDVQGTIVKMDSTSVTLNSGDKQIVMPLHKLISSTVEVW